MDSTATTTTTDTGGRAGRKEWIGLGLLVLPGMLVSMDMSVLYMALPWLGEDLRPSSAQLLWIIDIYGFLLAGLLITMGSLGDRIGRRRVLMAGAALFAVGSLAAAYSTSAEMLIAARALLGIGGATLAPSTLSLIRNMFHSPQQRRTAIGIWTAGFSGGAMLGPIIGGLLVESFWWGSVFLLNLPAMVLVLALAPLMVPEFRDPKAGRFDLISAVLSLAAVLPVIYGMKMFAEHGFAWTSTLCVVVGLALGAVFLHRQRKVDHPMIDLHLFRARAFSASLGAVTLAMFAMFGAMFFMSQYLQLVLGLRPFMAAVWTMPSLLGMMVGVTLATILVRFVRSGFIVSGGLLVAASGILVITGISAESGLPYIVVGGILMSGGLGAVTALITDLIVSSAPPERAGAASAISETANEFGGAVGIAVLGSVATAIYRAYINANTPSGLPDAAVDAARDTLAGATGAAAELPPAAAQELLAVAREAFTQGIHVSSYLGAGVLIVTAVLSAYLLRHTRPHSDDSTAGDTESATSAEADTGDGAHTDAESGRGGEATAVAVPRADG
ncbi:MFS transporter [Nocardiopsis gilva YIM 90087]|uniref:MFS transporter n=1 Tax=Nocardiopsis gilva YIM 90087 TaxID=1235441 RepID=A0A223S6I6_9ACTN|nr:MFS transporter [Nocardiopsis gilva]ASU83725.1 MFS transporter [Nocardiopsis gilva YIM 90087]